MNPSPGTVFENVIITDVRIMQPAGARKYGYDRPGYGFTFTDKQGRQSVVRVPYEGAVTITTQQGEAGGLFMQLDRLYRQEVTLKVPQHRNPGEKTIISGKVHVVYLGRDDHHNIIYVGVKIKTQPGRLQEVLIPVRDAGRVEIEVNEGL